MIFIIIALLLFAGIAFFQALQGTFSALIMAVLTIVSAGIAINYYAPLSQSYLLGHVPDYGDACMLAGLFFILLVILRTLTDNFIRGNIVTYGLPDRLFAGLVSIPTSLVIVGVGILSIQMLPFDEQLMLFNRFTYDVQEPGKLVRNGIFPYADDFAAGFASMLSDGSLSSEESFGLVHPDWPGEICANRIGVQRESKHVAMPGSVKVLRAWRFDRVLLIKKYPEPERGWSSRKQEIKVIGKYEPKDGHYFVGMQLEISPKAADGDGYLRFSWGQVRIVGFRGLNRQKTYDYYLVGMQDEDIPAEYNYMRVKVPLPLPKDDDEAPVRYRNYGFVSREKVSGPVDVNVVFELPDDFTPWFVEFKRWARTNVPKIEDSEDQESVGANGSEENESARTGEVLRKGWRAPVHLDADATGYIDDLPADIASAVGVSSIDVPADKSLLRVEGEFTPAASRLLRPIFGAVQSISQVYVVDDSGKRYFAVGKYIVLKRADGSLTGELVYEPEFGEIEGRLRPFRKLHLADLNNSNGGRVGFFFLIPHGVRIVRFEAGGRPFQAQAINVPPAP